MLSQKKAPADEIGIKGKPFRIVAYYLTPVTGVMLLEVEPLPVNTIPDVPPSRWKVPRRHGKKR